MERFTGPAGGRRLLDVGAYTGVFVEIAARHGWDAWGVEPSAWAVEEARRQGLQMVLGTLEDGSFRAGSYSVVTLWDVIEHVDNPAKRYRRLERCRARRLPGRSPMDLNSLFARLMGKRWPWFMEMHLTYFTRATLYAMLVKAGFSVTWMGAQGRYLHAGYLASRVTALFLLSGVRSNGSSPPSGSTNARCASIWAICSPPTRASLSETFGNRCGLWKPLRGSRNPRKERGPTI